MVCYMIELIETESSNPAVIGEIYRIQNTNIDDRIAYETILNNNAQL